MKFSIEIDCTPQEARQLLGLPDVEEFHHSMMKMIRERTLESTGAMDPEKLARMWMPIGKEALDMMQKAFASHLADPVKSSSEKPDD